MGRKLTDKQERFVHEYLVDLNATAAAKRAGYAESSARQSGHRNMKNDDIKKAIAERRAARKKRTQVDQDRVIEGLLREAERDEEGSSHSARVSAWAKLGKHLGMFTEQHSGEVLIRIEREDP